MSLQDDYYDLKGLLGTDDIPALERIWFAFCDYETQEMVRKGEVTDAEYKVWRSEKECLFKTKVRK